VHLGIENVRLLDELLDLHDVSGSVFVTLPLLKPLITEPQWAVALHRFEVALAAHIAYLDDVVSDVFLPRHQHDSAFSRSLFAELHHLQQSAALRSRDGDIARIVEWTRLFLIGACAFTVERARGANAIRIAEVVSDSLKRFAALEFPSHVAAGHAAMSRTSAGAHHLCGEQSALKPSAYLWSAQLDGRSAGLQLSSA
jgi:hypothetical protein